MRLRRPLFVVSFGLACGLIAAKLTAPPPAPPVVAIAPLPEKKPDPPPAKVDLGPMFGVTAPEAPPPAPVPEKKPEVPCPAKLVVRAAFVSDRPRLSSALLFDGTIVRGVTVGTDVDGWVVQAIRREPLEVDVQQAGRTCTVAASASPSKPTAMVEGLPGGSVVVDRRMVNEVETLAQDVRVMPTGRGFRVAWLKPGSPLSALGVQSGDVVTSVDGRPLDGPGAALEAWQRLSGGRSLEVGIDRNGTRIVRRFELR